MGTKANLNLSPIRKFISNSLLNLFPFSMFRFPVLRATFPAPSVPHFSNTPFIARSKDAHGVTVSNETSLVELLRGTIYFLGFSHTKD